jgi:hypothetical protein
LTDEPRPGAPRKATDDRIVDVITRTLEGPPAHATQWTTRSLAVVAGLSKATIARIWQTFGLQSHRLDTFKLSADPVLSENSIEPSRGSMIVTEEPTKSLAATDGAVSTRRCEACWRNQPIVKTLVIPFPVVMRRECGERSAQMGFAEDDDPIQALLLNRPHEALRIRIGRSPALHLVMRISRKFSRSRIPSTRCMGRRLSC